MYAIKREREMILAKITKEHYLGEDEIHIDFEELFQLLNKTPSTNVLLVAIVCK
jgi:hypothetical protein